MFVHQALRKLARENRFPVRGVKRLFAEFKADGETTKQAIKSCKDFFKQEVVVTNEQHS